MKLSILALLFVISSQALADGDSNSPDQALTNVSCYISEQILDKDGVQLDYKREPLTLKSPDDYREILSDLYKEMVPILYTGHVVRIQSKTSPNSRYKDQEIIVEVLSDEENAKGLAGRPTYYATGYGSVLLEVENIPAPNGATEILSFLCLSKLKQ